ncbi:MAG: ring-cleaving dioxygenase [Rhodobacterales bacterium]|nr:ring-cleaving dioxygenase [Rhodobacterales bacterium]
MTQTIPGIHHVTAISGPAQANVDFYTATLGQRLVKRTVNFDAPDTWHLYYGDRAGSPGAIMTFFPFADAAPGRIGPGMASAHAYAVPAGRFDGWLDRLRAAGIAFAGPVDRFGARVITLRDPDGAPVELVETDGTAEADLDGFHSVTLWLRDPARTARLLTRVFGYVEAGHERTPGAERLRLVAPGGARGSVVDLLRTDVAPAARPGAGTIHHVAFRAPGVQDQVAWQDILAQAGHRTTPVIDRQYFNAIYFREPGGVLFEIATDAPGFAVDEPEQTMGTRLMLPPQYEPIRDRIERVLPPLRVAA